MGALSASSNSPNPRFSCKSLFPYGKERNKEIPYKECILKGIGSSEGMHPYNGEVGVYGVEDSTRQELPAELRA